MNTTQKQFTLTDVSLKKRIKANSYHFLLGLLLTAAAMFPHQDATAGQAPVNLGSASRFSVLAASEITSVPTSAIKGDVGLSPAARSKISGLTPVEVIGTIFAADDGGAVAVMLTQAQGDLTTAYNDAAGRTLAAVDVANADLGGRTLTPGLYKSSGTLGLTGNLTLDAQGDPNAVFIFQIVSSLDTAPGSQVILSGRANAANIYWQVGTSATLGTTTIFKGNILADQSIALQTGATLEGRALARIAAVTLDANAITLPRPARPSFGAIRLSTNGSVTLVITNTPGLRLTVQTSPDLTNWIPLTMLIPTNSPAEFTDTRTGSGATKQGLLRKASVESMSFYQAFYPTDLNLSVVDEIDPHLVTFNRYTAGGSVSLWISAGCVAAGVPANSAWITGYETAIDRESSGDENACNIWDSNAITPDGFSKVPDWGNAWPASGPIYQLNGALTPFKCSRGVAQCIPQTFATYHAAGTSLNIYDPVANIAASINYVRQNYDVSADGSDLASKVQQFDPNRPPKGY